MPEVLQHTCAKGLQDSCAKGFTGQLCKGVAKRTAVPTGYRTAVHEPALPCRTPDTTAHTQLLFLATHVCYPLGASIDLRPEAKLSIVVLRSGFPAGVLLLLIQRGQPLHLVQKALPGMRLLGGRQHVGGCACLWTERALFVLLQAARRESKLVLDTHNLYRNLTLDTQRLVHGLLATKFCTRQPCDGSSVFDVVLASTLLKSGIPQ